jgi:hypothetical protein
VKTTDSSKQADIRYESELVHYFRDLIDADPDLQWSVPPQAASQNRLPWVELRLDDRSERFKPLYLLKPSVPELESRIANWEAPVPPLLVVPELSARVLDLCRQKRLAAIDLNGRAYIRVTALLVDRRPLPGRDFRFLLEPRNVFAGISARIVRALLTDRDRTWTQKELLPRTHASSGFASRIVQHLVSQGFLEKKSHREFRLRDPFALLDAWAKADDFARRTTTTRYAAFGATPLHTARQLKSWADQRSLPIALTQWIAGWLRHPYTEPIIVAAYVARLPDAATLEHLALRPVSDAGKVWLHVPDDEGVFLETQTLQDLPLVSDAQIYLDLQQTGLRGPDQANALRNWEGFCRS